MKNIISNKMFLLYMLLLATTGCFHKKPKTSSLTKADTKNIKTSTTRNVATPADEDVTEFSLKEEDGNPFTSESDNAHKVQPLGEFGQKYNLKTIYYDFDKYHIRKNQLNAAKENLEIIKNLVNKGHEVVLEGHACNSAGSTEYNMILSENRANTFAKYLAKHGVDRKKLKTVGRGSEMRIVPFGDKEQQAPNRRVGFYVIEHN